MSSENTPKEENKINWRNVLIAITVAVIALIGAFISKAQNEAASASALAGNESQQAYYKSIGLRIGGEADVSNAFRTEYQLWYRYNVQRSAAQKQGDLAAAQTFTSLRDAVEKNSSSKIFDPAYFNRDKPSVNLALYTADKYGRELYRLAEEQKAAEDVSSAWDDKAGLYGLHLTLLVVAGFLLGLALMTKAEIPTRVFTVTGVLMVVAVSGWALQVSSIPVFDLRKTQAITAFAEGASLSDQQRWDEALTKFNEAINAAGIKHPYAQAYLHRAQVYLARENFAEAINDYNQAIAAGLQDDPTLYGDLVWAYFQMGDFDNAIQKGEAALKNARNDLPLRQRVNMAKLLKGGVNEADQQNEILIKIATEQVIKQRQVGDSPAEIWWALSNAAYQYDQLSHLLKQADTDAPIKKNSVNANAVAAKADELANKLRSAVIALKYNLPETNESLATAQISAPQFALSSTPDNKYIFKVDMKFKYSGLTQGQLLSIVVYRNNIEDPSWSFNQQWTSARGDGSTSVTLNPTYDSLFIVPPGLYEVDIYLNANLISQGEFKVADPNNPDVATAADTYTSADMLDQFDTASIDLLASDSGTDTSYAYDDPFFFLYTQYDYWDYLTNYFDVSPEDCSNSDDLNCFTEPVNCALDPNNTFCQVPEIPICESDPTLLADDPNCASLGPTETPADEVATLEPACPSDPNLTASDPACPDATPSLEPACPSDPNLAASDPACPNATPTDTPEPVCPYDPNLTAGDPNCVAPTDTPEPICPYDPNLPISDPNCVEPSPTP